MLKRLVTAVAVIGAVVACGGGGQSTSVPGGSVGPGQSQQAPNTPAPVGPGEPIDTAAIQAAVSTLKEQESWQFEATKTSLGVQGSASGTERPPEQAIDAEHEQPGDGPPFRYIRIGDQIWYDVGTGSFTEIDAANAENLIEQYEPYYLTALAESATSQDWAFDPVGNEDVGGIATTHYTLNESDRQEMAENLDVAPEAFAGDVWIAMEGGYLVRMTWGPQSTENAEITTGFDYLVTAVDCTCPIEPPDGGPPSTTGAGDPYDQYDEY